jgi:uncharacterized protein with GYD domain
MAKFLFQANYTAQGLKGLMKEGGSARREAVEKACAAAGGRLEAMYFAFGDVDAYVIADLPNNTAAAAMALAVNGGGGATTKTVVLMTAAEADEATKKAVAYRPPGG